MKNSLLHLALCPALAALAAANAPAQALPPIAPVKPQGLPIVRSYQPVQVPELRVSGSSRLHGLIRAGTLYLSVRDAIALALESSLDLEIERYNIVSAGWQVQRAQSGGPLRGVTGASTVAVSVGAGQGVAGIQRSGGAGSAGGIATVSGAALIQQIGPITPQLDPVLSISSTFSHQTTPEDQLILAGANELVDTFRTYDAQLQQGLLTGATVRMAYHDSYENESAPTDVLNPTSFAYFGISYSQSLLKGFGERVNGRFIRIAGRGVARSQQQFRARVIAVVAGVLNDYWDLSVAAGDLQYKRRNFELAQELLADIRKQIAAGAVPADDLIAAQSAAALQQQALRVAANAAIQRENAMKDLLTWHGIQDPALDAVHIVTVDPLAVPDIDDLPPIAELLATARNGRPDMVLARMAAEAAQITATGTANGLLPNLRVGVSTYNFGQTGTPVPGAGADPYFAGGLGSALGEVLRRNFPNERAFISFSAPLKNRQAQADYDIDALSHRQTQLNMQRTLNNLAVDISNQVAAIRQARARYAAAVESRQLSEKLLAGEDRKLHYGTSTVNNVVNSRRDLANAQSAELAAAAAYVHAKVALDQGLGLTLERNDVSIDDAMKQ
jgi:outer membrane protein TolC